jgi:16S rRNA A1518/A1519 N6-dimethyltransferase RsmA/KsgA/DIM1 with predicted DNA glycosylase/AP lyase activity
VRTDRETVTKIVELLSPTRTDRIIDIGAGDGELVIALAKSGAKVTGVEINLFLVLVANWRIWRSGLSKNARVLCRNMWWYEMRGLNKVVVYGFPTIMLDLGEKLKRELARPAVVVSNSFEFKNLGEAHAEGKLYVYVLRN